MGLAKKGVELATLRNLWREGSGNGIGEALAQRAAQMVAVALDDLVRVYGAFYQYGSFR